MFCHPCDPYLSPSHTHHTCTTWSQTKTTYIVRRSKYFEVKIRDTVVQIRGWVEIRIKLEVQKWLTQKITQQRLLCLPGYLFFMIKHVIQKMGGNKNSPNPLNIMVNYHYHGENRVITL